MPHGGVQAEHVGHLRQRKHHHLEGDDHIQQEQHVDDLRRTIVHSHDPPGAHRSAQEDDEHRTDRDEQAPSEASHEVGLLDSVLVVEEPGELLARRQGEGVGGDINLLLEGIDQYQGKREQPCQGDDREQTRPERAVLDTLVHAWTSLLVVSLFWMMAIRATRMKNITAFA